MKRIVVVGGGSGIFNVLKGLKQYPVHITSIVTTFDNGGSTGLLRDEFGILPPGDLRRSLVALAPETGDSTLRELFNVRFPEEGSLHGHSFGNLFLQALTTVSGSEIGAIKKAADILGITHDIFPVSIDRAHLCAELLSGEVIKGETNIDIPKHDGSIGITRIYLEPKAILYSEAYEAIVNADLVVIGPGDLYTSILPNVITEGFTDAIKERGGRTVYVLNTMTKWGETNGFAASDFLRVLLSYLKQDQVDYVIGGTAPLEPRLIERYKEERAEPVAIDTEQMRQYAQHIVLEDVVSQTDVIRHDASKIARVLMGLL